MKLTERLEKWVAEGGSRIGEVGIVPREGGGYRLTHVGESSARAGDLKTYSSPIDVREIVRYDASDEYRPLKSAPGLIGGWELELSDAAELREALDYFYPAAVGTWFANTRGELEAVPLRDLLGRQTGMYRFANSLSDEGAQALVADVCGAAGGCLKRVCWPLAGGKEITSLPDGETSRAVLAEGEMPILCVEGCNWLVAKARKASAAEFEARREG